MFLCVFQKDNALELWNQALEKKPFVSTWIMERARVYGELKQYQKAKEELDALEIQIRKPIESTLHQIEEERNHILFLSKSMC